MSFPFDLQSAAVSDSHLPCRAHAIPDHAVLLKVTAQHGLERLLARVRLLPATRRSSTKVLSDAHQSQMQVASVKPNTVCMDEESVVAEYYKEDSVGLAVRIFPATMRTFTKDKALSEHGRRAAWHV